MKRILDKNSQMIENTAWTPETIAIARKAIVIAIVLAVLFIYSGVTPMIFYTSTIFEETGSNLSPNFSAIIVGVLIYFNKKM